MKHQYVNLQNQITHDLCDKVRPSFGAIFWNLLMNTLNNQPSYPIYDALSHSLEEDT